MLESTNVQDGLSLRGLICIEKELMFACDSLINSVKLILHSGNIKDFKDKSSTKW